MPNSERLDRTRSLVLPRLTEALGEDGYVTKEHRDELTVIVPKRRLCDVLGFLQDEPTLRFDTLKDICAVDWNRRRERFEIVYNLWSLQNSVRLRVKCVVEESDPHVDSVTGIYSAANWYERETYDMHGIFFDGHPDLRRMYMPEDFVDPTSGEPLYPLRKDFPMMGVPGSLPLPERN